MRALHDLEEITCPSDSFLFYQDIEQEIEQATAAKLEGFIAMKTRPIHNSVKKLTERAESGVKSVVGWIKTGGKNIREVMYVCQLTFLLNVLKEDTADTPVSYNQLSYNTIHSSLKLTSSKLTGMYDEVDWLIGRRGQPKFS